MMKQKTQKTTKWLILCAALVVGAVTPVLANASSIAPQPCDPKYWDTMSARAWMEAEREIMQNQNLIFKPDSVMEYACFDNMVSHGAKHLGEIFVHNGYFGKVIIPRGATPHSQEKALQNVVSASLQTYLSNNFDHEFLGQRAGKLKKKPDPVNSTFVTAESQKDYGPCKIMAEVWKASKCINFVDNDEFKNTDGFYPFRSLKDLSNKVQVPGYEEIKDVRFWPSKCDNVTKEDWTNKDDVATNKNELYKFKEPLKKDFEDVRKLVEPGQCGTAIETGVTIILTGQGAGSNKKDKVCTNPGCTLVGDTCQ